jgi:hypothetical protein
MAASSTADTTIRIVMKTTGSNLVVAYLTTLKLIAQITAIRKSRKSVSPKGRRDDSVTRVS